ncbi:hypothetical protein T01_9721, partial [Trichinella spiralis]
MFMFAFIDMFIDSIDYALQGETMGMHKVRIVSLSPKAVSEQDGIVEVPEETDFSGITSLNKTVPFKILSLERGNLLGNEGEELVDEKKEKEDMDTRNTLSIESTMPRVGIEEYVERREVRGEKRGVRGEKRG